MAHTIRALTAFPNLPRLVAYVVFGAPVVAGLALTLAPAFGYLPALSGRDLSLAPWRILFAEPGFGEGILTGLERLGHRLHRVGPLEGPCSVQAIRVMENGVRMAGSDPRRDGWAGAF